MQHSKKGVLVGKGRGAVACAGDMGTGGMKGVLDRESSGSTDSGNGQQDERKCAQGA